jgi:hypothetical protein
MPSSAAKDWAAGRRVKPFAKTLHAPAFLIDRHHQMIARRGADLAHQLAQLRRIVIVAGKQDQAPTSGCARISRSSASSSNPSTSNMTGPTSTSLILSFVTDARHHLPAQ